MSIALSKCVLRLQVRSSVYPANLQNVVPTPHSTVAPSGLLNNSVVIFNVPNISVWMRLIDLVKR